MVWKMDKKLNESRLKRVNKIGVPHPDPHYQGWYFRPWDRLEAWEYFRFTSNGELEVHHFDTDASRGVSPLGSPNYVISSISTGGKRCGIRKSSYIH